MRRVLFVHNGSSGRFRFVAESLRERGWSGVLFNPSGGSDLPGFRTIRVPTARHEKPADRLFQVTAASLARGRVVADLARQIKAQGFAPDLIIGHSGWGEMIFLREVYPDTPQTQLAEFYYRSRGADVGFDPEFDRPSFERDLRLQADNAFLTLSLSEADRIVTPTRFQADLFPAVFRPRTRIIHEGIDTSRSMRRADASVTIGARRFVAGQPVVTFINRYFEPMRGFHSFMRALPKLLAGNPDAHVLIIGSREPKGYGPKLKEGDWYQRMMQEVGGAIDRSRVHLLGQVDYATLVDCLSISAAHVYLTYPFVLSWSLLDAMACECLLIGSDTAPVREVIRDGVNGVLVDFFDHGALASRLLDALARPEVYAPLRAEARRTVVERYDRAAICDPAWLALIDELAPPVTREAAA